MGFRWVFVFLLLLPIAFAQPACQLQTPNGYIPDADCDGWDDYIDNCPYDANSNQADQNQNGAGDACDHIKTTIDFTPSTIAQPGDITTLYLKLTNTRPHQIDNIQVTLTSNDLDLDLQTHHDSLFSGEYHTFDFLIKIPSCIATGSKQITLTLDYSDGETILKQTLFETINVAQGNCDREESTLDNTRLDTIIFQEILAGDSAIYPLTFTNANTQAQTYDITLEQLEHATYRLDPMSQITVPSGSSETIYLYIDTEETYPPGNSKISIIVETIDATERIDVGLRILNELEQKDYTHAIKTSLEVALIVLVIILIIGGIILTMKKAGERR